MPLLRLRGTASWYSGVPRMEERKKRKGDGRGMKYVNKPVRKKDAMQLVTGKPVYG